VHHRFKFRRNRSKRFNGQRLKYRNFSIFQYVGHRHLGFSKFQIVNGRRLQRVELCRRAKFGRNQSAAPLPGYDDFSIFQDGGRLHHLGFLNF